MQHASQSICICEPQICNQHSSSQILDVQRLGWVQQPATTLHAHAAPHQPQAACTLKAKSQTSSATADRSMAEHCNRHGRELHTSFIPAPRCWPYHSHMQLLALMQPKQQHADSAAKATVAETATTAQQLQLPPYYVHIPASTYTLCSTF